MENRSEFFCEAIEKDVIVDYSILDNIYTECACSGNDNNHCTYKLNKRCDDLNKLFEQLKSANV